MRHGRFVFLGSHGAKGAIITPLMQVVPDERGSESCLWSISRTSAGDHVSWNARQVQVGGDLQFVYVSACGGGEKGELWQAALTPAEVRTFPRTCAVGEHIAWMWINGPSCVQEIK